MDDWSVSIAVEDKYVIFGLNKKKGMLPEDALLDGLIAAFSPLRDAYTPVLDMGGVDVLTSDVLNFVEEWTPNGANVIIARGQTAIMHDWPKSWQTPTPVHRRGWRYKKMSLAHFLDDDDIRNYGLHNQVRKTIRLAGTEPPTKEEWQLVCDAEPSYEETYGNYRKFRSHFELAHYEMLNGGASLIVGARALREVVRSIGRNSLMTELALVPDSASGIVAVPYHANALYETRAGRSGNAVIIARPGVLAKNT